MLHLKLYVLDPLSVIIKDLEADDHHNQTNYLIIQNKGTFYKALDLKKVNNIIMILYCYMLYNIIIVIVFFFYCFSQFKSVIDVNRTFRQFKKLLNSYY